MLVEMAAEGMGDRVALGPAATGTTYAGLLDAARRMAGVVREAGVERLVLVDVNSAVVPILLFGRALAGAPFAPINYRLADDHLRKPRWSDRPALAVVEEAVLGRVGDVETQPTPG